ncbi:unnamed protein product, partial [Amoebophrya sp. A120]
GDHGEEQDRNSSNHSCKTKNVSILFCAFISSRCGALTAIFRCTRTSTPASAAARPLCRGKLGEGAWRFPRSLLPFSQGRARCGPGRGKDERRGPRPVFRFRRASRGWGRSRAKSILVCTDLSRAAGA